MTTTIVLRESSVEAIKKSLPDLLPADYERRAKGRGHQCVFEIADTAALLSAISKLAASTSNAVDRATLKADLSRLSGSVPTAKPVVTAEKITETATATEPVDPESRDVVAVNPYRKFRHNCECGKGWDSDMVAHCNLCHVSFDDAAAYKHRIGPHNAFRTCLHPSEMRVKDNGHDVWVNAA